MLKPNLSQKALILVSVPLIFEIGFFATLGLLLHEAERQTEREQHSRNVVEEVSSLQRSFINSARGVAAYAIAKKMGMPIQNFVMVETEDAALIRLKKLTANDASQRDSVAKIEKIFNQVMAVVMETKRTIDDGMYEGGMLHARLLHQELNRVGTEFQQETRAIEARERRKAALHPKRSADMRRMIDQLLQAGVISSVLIAFGLAAYFNRATTRRLNVLMDNTERMVNGTGLNTVLEGDDEIAHLDRSFHNMAEIVDASMRKERAIIENMPVGVVIIDDGGMITIINPKTEQLFGYPAEELKGKPFSILFGEELNSFEFIVCSFLSSAPESVD